MLLLDEAHATGVLWRPGQGTWRAQYEGAPNIISLHTCGKALGVCRRAGLPARLYRDFLVNRGRAFIYSTAPSPLMAAVVRAALKISRGRRAGTDATCSAGAPCRRRPATAWALPASGSQIQPVILGEDRRAVALAEALAGARLRHPRHPSAHRARRHRAACASRSPCMSRPTIWTRCSPILPARNGAAYEICRHRHRHRHRQDGVRGGPGRHAGRAPTGSRCRRALPGDSETVRRTGRAWTLCRKLIA